MSRNETEGVISTTIAQKVAVPWIGTESASCFCSLSASLSLPRTGLGGRLSASPSSRYRALCTSCSWTHAFLSYLVERENVPLWRG
jgi:hypothetical protein